jgi:peptidoglycan/LPS O-acetylase OafA/YrhL
LIFVLSLFLPILLGLFLSKLFIFVLATSLFAYIGFILYVSKRLYDKNARYINIFWGFVVLHFSYGIGSLIGLFRFDIVNKK